MIESAERTARPQSPRLERGSAPARIEAPAIGVPAPVIRLGLNPDRTPEVPSTDHETGRWAGGPSVGQPGPAVTVGHVDSVSGPAVFSRLRELAMGDAIRVSRRDGVVTRYRVTGARSVSKDDVPTREVYGRTSGPTLRLIACGGSFDASSGHRRDNLVVLATIA